MSSKRNRRKGKRKTFVKVTKKMLLNLVKKLTRKNKHHKKYKQKGG